MEEEQKETVVEEQPKETVVEEQPKETLNEVVTKIKEQYENKIANIIKEKDEAIKQRDEVITQLLNGESTAPQPTIVDNINAKRTFKKW